MRRTKPLPRSPVADLAFRELVLTDRLARVASERDAAVGEANEARNGLTEMVEEWSQQVDQIVANRARIADLEGDLGRVQALLEEAEANEQRLDEARDRIEDLQGEIGAIGRDYLAPILAFLRDAGAADYADRIERGEHLEHAAAQRLARLRVGVE